MPFPEYLETVRKNEALWRGVYARVRLPDGVVAEARALPGTWHLLALSEDWCGDAVNILPVVARFTEALPNVDLRVLSRDENLDLMDAHLTNGRSRSIPVVILYDHDFRERGWWGPRPSGLQKWVMEEGMKMEPGPRYAETRRFYARDKGNAILAEVLDLIRSAATTQAQPRRQSHDPIHRPPGPDRALRCHPLAPHVSLRRSMPAGSREYARREPVHPTA